MRRKRRRSTYVGCSLASHHGKLRLEWRVPDPTRPRRWKLTTWRTGDDDTPANREKWEPNRRLVAALRGQGVDPLPHRTACAPCRAVSPAQPASPQPDTGSGPTVAEFYRDWMAATEGDVRPALARDRRRHFGTYIAPDPIADMPLAALRPMDIQLFQARLRQRVSIRKGHTLSEKTVSCVIKGTLRAMVRDATVQDLVTRDVFVGLT
jgi:hypothetical protein